MVRITKDPEERKEEIMDTAQELFLRAGFEKTSVNEIIKKVGVAKGTFYYYFHSKDEILGAIVERFINNIEVEVTGIQQNFELNAQQKLQMILIKLFYSGAGTEKLAQPIDSERNGKIHRSLEEKFIVKFKPLILKVVVQGIKEKIFNTCHPEEITEILLIGIQGYMHINYPYFHNPDLRNKKMKALEELLERALGTQKDSFNFTV